MVLSLLLEGDFPAVPSGLEVIENYGSEVVISDHGSVAEGDVVLVRGDRDDFLRWLGGREVWVGNGMLGFKRRRVPKVCSVCGGYQDVSGNVGCVSCNGTGVE